MTEATPPASPEPQSTETLIPPTTTSEPAPSLLSGEPAPATEAAPAPEYVPLTAEELTGLFGDNRPAEGLLEKISSTFTELKLDKAGAEKAVALYSTLQEQAAQATATAWNETIKAWQDQAKAHPDFGGAKFDTSLAQAKQIVQDYGDQAFQEMLAVTGVGNHPAMIGFILKVAKAIPGEAAPAATTATSAPRDLASILFPTHGAN